MLVKVGNRMVLDVSGHGYTGAPREALGNIAFPAKDVTPLFAGPWIDLPADESTELEIAVGDEGGVFYSGLFIQPKAMPYVQGNRCPQAAGFRRRQPDRRRPAAPGYTPAAGMSARNVLQTHAGKIGQQPVQRLAGPATLRVVSPWIKRAGSRTDLCVSSGWLKRWINRRKAAAPSSSSATSVEVIAGKSGGCVRL